jgi:hypothetical protein
MTSKFIFGVPFTGLGLYGGFRGDRWLKNRIKIFEQFVLPSLLNQSDRDFALAIFWRPEERFNKIVRDFEERMSRSGLQCKFIYSGILMYDDKYEDKRARERYGDALHSGLHELLDLAPDADYIYWMLQPSDDCYHRETVRSVKLAFQDPDTDAISGWGGYICNYKTGEVREYNPKTNPPFAAIKFERITFFDPARHLVYLGLKEDTEKYKAGTPLPSHEYLPKCLRTKYFGDRSFLVGCHGENISTFFNHPYGGQEVDQSILEFFGIRYVGRLKLKFSLRKWVMNKLPHPVRRKLRYWFGELIGQKIYEFLRR